MLPVNVLPEILSTPSPPSKVTDKELPLAKIELSIVSESSPKEPVINTELVSANNCCARILLSERSLNKTESLSTVSSILVALSNSAVNGSAENNSRGSKPSNLNLFLREACSSLIALVSGLNASTLLLKLALTFLAFEPILVRKRPQSLRIR